MHVLTLCRQGAGWLQSGSRLAQLEPDASSPSATGSDAQPQDAAQVWAGPQLAPTGQPTPGQGHPTMSSLCKVVRIYLHCPCTSICCTAVICYCCRPWMHTDVCMAPCQVMRHARSVQTIMTGFHVKNGACRQQAYDLSRSLLLEKVALRVLQSVHFTSTVNLCAGHTWTNS